MALPPLHDAPYIAFYEEAEILAALHAWQRMMREDIPAGASMLIAEYQKHLLTRGRFYYPSELPPAELAPEPKEGPINTRLFVPLEGLGAPGEPVGTVGQAIYAAAAPFILSTRCWHRWPGIPFMIYCSYPSLHVEYSGNSRRGRVLVRLSGSPQLDCDVKLHILRPLRAELEATVAGDGPLSWADKKTHEWSARVAGGSDLEFYWGMPPGRVAFGRE